MNPLIGANSKWKYLLLLDMFYSTYALLYLCMILYVKLLSLPLFSQPTSLFISPLVYKLPSENNTMPLFFSFHYLGEESVFISLDF